MSSGSCKKAFSEAWSSLSIQTDLLFSSCCNVFPLVTGRASSFIFYFTYLRTRTKLFFKQEVVFTIYVAEVKGKCHQGPLASSYSLLVNTLTARSVPVLHTQPHKHCFLYFLSSEGCCYCCYIASVVSDSVRPQRQQPTSLPHPWDSPGKNTGVGCHFLLQCMKVKSESEVAESCQTLIDPMDCSLPGSSVHGIFQARVLEWGATAFS